MSSDKTQGASELLQSLPTEAILAEMQRRLDCLNKPEKRLILIGPPGSGKGTQVRCDVAISRCSDVAKIVSNSLCLPSDRCISPLTPATPVTLFTR